MPILPKPQYRPPFPFTSGHLQTIYPTLFRSSPELEPQRVRIDTPDGDFIDLDLHKSNTGSTKRLAVVSHGLEGNARKKYPLGMARILTEHGWDVICFNFRGCSGEMNRLPRFYHSGVTDDLHTVLCHGLATGKYTESALIGFSMGGNQTLKYLGENTAMVPEEVKAAVVFSVPCNLADSVDIMSLRQNRLYMKYFMKSLAEKIRIKARMFPNIIQTTGLDEIVTFAPFDDRYTAPLHGFKDAADYYKRCSSKQFLCGIKVPTLMVQAYDDPFLSSSCYPVDEAEESNYLNLEISEFGGHVGFMGPWRKRHYWSEKRTEAFLAEVI